MVRLLAVAIVLASTSAIAQESASEYFTKEKAQHEPAGDHRSSGPNVASNSVTGLIAAKAEQRLGKQWVGSALKIAKIESGYRCSAVGPRTRGGRARGVFQVMPRTARGLGFDPERATKDCDYSIDVGLAHMALCIRSGVRTESQMAACHVAGVGGWNRRLNRSSERYKQKYIRLARR